MMPHCKSLHHVKQNLNDCFSWFIKLFFQANNLILNSTKTSNVEFTTNKWRSKINPNIQIVQLSIQKADTVKIFGSYTGQHPIMG